MPHYRIKPGRSFRDTDDTVKTEGELIELDEQTARQHAAAGGIEPDPVPPEPAADPGPAYGAE